MEERDRQIHDRLRLISRFLRSHPDVPRDVIESGLMIKLDETIAQLDYFAAMQDRLNRSDAFVRRDDLRERMVTRHIEPIILLARVNGRNEVFRKVFFAPDLGSRTDTLAHKVEGLAGVAEEHAEFFVRLGLRPTFVSELKAIAAEHDDAANEARSLESEKIGVIAGINQEIDQGRVLIKALNGLIRHHLGSLPALKAQWKEVKRLPAHRAVGRLPELPAPPNRKALPAATAPENEHKAQAIATESAEVQPPAVQPPPSLPALADGQVAALPIDTDRTPSAESPSAISKLFGWMKGSSGA